MKYNELSAVQKAQIANICRKNDITRPEDIEKAYNNYVEGKSIFDGLSEGYQRASAFGKFLANGGHIYDGDTEPTQQMDSRLAFPWIEMARQEEQAYQNAMQEPYFQVNGRISKDEWRERNKPRDPGQITQSKYPSGPVGLGQMIDEYAREAKYRANNGELMLHGKYGLPLAGLAAGAGAAAGSVLPTILANPYVDAGLVSMGGAHAAQSIANGEADWMTALELAPMVRPAKAMYQVAKPFVGPIVDAVAENAGKARTFLGSPATGKWTQFGNKEYRFEPGRMFEGFPIGELESRPSGFDGISIPEGYTPVRVLNLKTKNGYRTVHQVRENSTGKFKNLEDLQFKSELDWSPKSWYEEAGGRKYKDGSWNEYNDTDIKDLESHIPEYIEIERKAKMDGTWLKMPDGSTWEGDPRSWVQLQSKAAKDAAHGQEKEVFWTGINKKIDPNFNERIWGVPVQNHSKLALAKARTYTPNDSGIMPMFTVKYENPEAISVVDAKGHDWHAIPYNGEFIKTDYVVDDIFARKGKKVTKINNVLDTGEYRVPPDSKYYYEGVGNNVRVPQDDIILNDGTFRKALIGGNGNFKHPTHIYRSIIPAVATTGLGYSMFSE